jgi:hypothetical protein
MRPRRFLLQRGLGTPGGSSGGCRGSGSGSGLPGTTARSSQHSLCSDVAQVGLLSALRVVGPWYPHLSAYVIIRNFGTLLAVIFIYTLCPDGSPKTPSTEMQQRGPGPEGAPHPALLTPLNSNRRPVSNNA